MGADTPAGGRIRPPSIREIRGFIESALRGFA